LRLQQAAIKWKPGEGRPGALAASGLLILVCLTALLPWRAHLVGPLCAILEGRFVRAGDLEWGRITGLIVLGGRDERLHEAGRLARQHSHLKIFVSGAGPEAQVWRQLGRDIDPKRVVIETLSRNTFENAINSHRLIAPQSGERWLLVTSALHMPRAAGAFRRVGFAVEAWPVDDRPEKVNDAWELVWHEWLGLAWYWLRDQSEALLPGPGPALAQAPR